MEASLSLQKEWYNYMLKTSYFTALNYNLNSAFRYSIKELMQTSLSAANSFFIGESENYFLKNPLQSYSDSMKLLISYQQLASDFFFDKVDKNGKRKKSVYSTLNEFYQLHFALVLKSIVEEISEETRNDDTKGITAYLEKWFKVSSYMVNFSKMVKQLDKEFGFHFENKDMYKLVDETDRFWLYQVLPTKKIKLNNSRKPVLMIHPYLLGANVLSLLPNENQSFVHAFANEGIPVYVRIVKDVESTVPLQVMKLEDDCNDTARFCRIVSKRHNLKVSLCGVCQGGQLATMSMLSGKLDKYVDTLLLVVTPIDGTKGNLLYNFMNQIPDSYKDINYSVKFLKNGNKVVDGYTASFGFKMKNFYRDMPPFEFFNNLRGLWGKVNGEELIPDKTELAVHYWLMYDRVSIPVSIAEASNTIFRKSIAEDGTYPLKLFGKKLNINHLNKKKINCHLTVAKKDDIIDGKSSLILKDYVKNTTVCVVEEGHIYPLVKATLPDDPYSLHKEFSGNVGVIKYHLDMERKLGLLKN